MKLLDKQEKAQLVERFEDVALAKDDGTTRMFTKGGNRKRWMRHDYAVFDCGAILKIEKPSIESTVYYDDEQEDPLVDREKRAVFIAHNMFHCFDDWGVSEWLDCEKALADGGSCSGAHVSTPYLMKHRRQESDDGLVDQYALAMVRFMCKHPELDEPLYDDGWEKHELAPEERSQFIELVAMQRCLYRKRLEAYYRRYEDKITSEGYWANR